MCPITAYLEDIRVISRERLESIAAGVNAVCAFFSFHYFNTNKAVYQLLKGLTRGSVFVLAVVDKTLLLDYLAGRSSLKSRNYEYTVKG